MNRLLIVTFCSLVIFSSCHFLHGDRIKGSGNVVSQARPASNFTAVSVSSAIDLYIKQDSAFSVKVETDDNLQKYIIVSEENGVLYIKQSDNTSLDETGKIKVYVSAPALNGLKASGACNIIGESVLTSSGTFDVHLSGASEAQLELKAPKIVAGVNGASNITLKGETKDLKIEGEGASDAKCFDLLSENADVDVSGASSAEVYASVKLEAEASGASNIRYKGNAAVNKSESGASKVEKAQ